MTDSFSLTRKSVGSPQDPLCEDQSVTVQLIPWMFFLHFPVDFRGRAGEASAAISRGVLIFTFLKITAGCAK